MTTDLERDLLTHCGNESCLACQTCRDRMAAASYEIERLNAALAEVQAARRRGDEIVAGLELERERLQAIVDGAEAAREDYVVEYGWNHERNLMGYWYGPRGSFVSDRLTWAGTSRLDAWLAIGKMITEKARAL